MSVLDSSWYGVPQCRKRVFVVALRDPNARYWFPFVTHDNGMLGNDTLPRLATLRDAIWGMPSSPSDCVKYSLARARFMAAVPPGGNWRNMPMDIMKSAMGGALQSGGGRTGFFRRLSWDKPCPTLVCSPTAKATGLCHPDHVRPLSVGEYKRIQQFPDDWVVCGSLADQYR